jgi:hypothetical protein
MGRRSWAYALLTATAAVSGLLVLRAAFAYVPSLTFEFLANRLTYIYVFVATAAVFLARLYARSTDRRVPTALGDGLIDRAPEPACIPHTLT